MTQDTSTQETPSPTQHSAELTPTALALVVGGTAWPGNAGEEGPYAAGGGVPTGGGRTVPILVPS